METVIVRIFGEELTLRVDQDPAYVRAVAEFVDAKMREAAKGASMATASRIALLAAVNIADELFRCRGEVDGDRARVNAAIESLIRYVDQAARDPRPGDGS
jgi:cell division protein ZapA